MFTAVVWIVLLLGSAAGCWYFFTRVRGALRYWIRSFDQPPMEILGKTLPADAATGVRQQLLTDVNSEVRSLEQRVTTVAREWDQKSHELFMGVALRKPLDGEVPEGYELRKHPARKVLRISGDNRLDEQTRAQVMESYLKKHELSVVRDRPVQLSGQSFSLYEWEISKGGEETSALSRFSEWTFQLRDNLVLPLVGVVIALALVATRQPLLFAIGVCLVTFLSGACKFIFIHQRADEADEVHLQNY